MQPLKVYKCRQINRNNQLFGLMKYQVKSMNAGDFFRMRSWCLKTFGESVEYNYHRQHTVTLGINPPWSWDTDRGPDWYGHLYFKDDAELAMFEREFSDRMSRQMCNSV